MNEIMLLLGPSHLTHAKPGLPTLAQPSGGLSRLQRLTVSQSAIERTVAQSTSVQ